MRELIEAVIVAAAGGFAFFLIGQLLPRKWFDPLRFPYRSYGWENKGRIYLKIKVNCWKDIVPDMSRIIPGVFKKKARLATTPEAMWRLIQETCVAEFVHWLLIVLITPLVYLAMRGLPGALAAAAYIAGNMVFVVIQRYNRPRLTDIQKRLEKRREKCS